MPFGGQISSHDHTRCSVCWLAIAPWQSSAKTSPLRWFTYLFCHCILINWLTAIWYNQTGVSAIESSQRACYPGFWLAQAYQLFGEASYYFFEAFLLDSLQDILPQGFGPNYMSQVNSLRSSKNLLKLVNRSRIDCSLFLPRHTILIFGGQGCCYLTCFSSSLDIKVPQTWNYLASFIPRVPPIIQTYYCKISFQLSALNFSDILVPFSSDLLSLYRTYIQLRYSDWKVAILTTYDFCFTIPKSFDYFQTWGPIS